MSEHIGKPVLYTDEVGKKHHALVTNFFGNEDGFGTTASINVVFVQDDASQHDPYGRQIGRQVSVTPKAAQAAHGRYYEVA